MKRSIFFLIVVIVIALVFGCKTTETVEDDLAEPFIWRLLRSGDDKAMGYFHGEFDANITDFEGKTPLHYAVIRKDAPLARFFLALGADPNALDNEQQSPLGIAVENNDIASISILIASGTNIHLPINENTTAAAQALAKGGQVFESILTPVSVNAVNSRGQTLLHMASALGNFEAVNQILAVSSTSNLINRKDRTDKNSLDYALEKPDSLGHIQIAEKLILAGGLSDNEIFSYFGPAVRSGNYNLRRNEGLAPIHYAVIGNHEGLISFLLEKNIDVNLKSTSGATALHEAARTGNIPVIKHLIEKGADVNSKDAKGNTPLHTGIPARVHLEVISIFVDNDADLNIRDEHGDTPLHIAITLDRYPEIIEGLIEGGADVHIRNIQGQTPLYIAVHDRRINLIPILITNGAELFAADNSGITPFDVAFRVNGNLFDILVTPETVNQRDTAGNTLLHATIRNRGTPEQIARILNQRPLVDATNRAGDTALHLAARTNQRHSGEFLISRGADIFSNNAAGESPIFIALSAPNIRQWMINHTTIQAKDGLGNNILHYAAQWNIDNAIPLIIRGGILIESANETGETPLFMAVKTDSPSTIRVLTDNNANINARDSQGNSLLHAAVRWNARRSAALLIASGMDVNVFSLNGNTPLHDAVILGMSDIETLLIQEKANLEVRNIEGNTPFMEAVRVGFVPSLEKLAAAGADISTRNTRGDTPLHFAVNSERIDLVRALLRLNASIHARNTRNRTPFQASIGISEQMVRTLLTRNRINQSDDMGNSALHIALQESAPLNILRTIITQGGRINAVDSNGKTPLRTAIDLEQWESAKLLADSGANPFIAAVDGNTPAELAFEKGEDCVRAIFSGIAINAKDSSNNTILHIGARYGSPELISILLELGASKNARNISSEIPYEIAIRWNRNENAEILR